MRIALVGRSLVTHAVAAALRADDRHEAFVVEPSARALEVDVVVVDLGRLPTIDAVSLVSAARARYPDHPLVGIRCTEAAVVAAVSPEVDELLPGTDLAGLVTALDTLDPARVAAGRGPTRSRPTISDKEAEVLELLGQGLRDDEIAERLAVTRSTVRAHVGSATRKLGTKDRASAVAAWTSVTTADTGYVAPSMAQRRWTVAVSSTDALVHDALVCLLAGQPGVEIVDDHAPPDHGIDVLVVDELGRIPKAPRPVSRSVLFVAPRQSPVSVHDAILGGADGFVLGSAHPDELLAAVDRLALGGAHLPVSLLRSFVDEIRRERLDDDLARDRFAALTHRERSVLALLVEGHTNEGIADELFVSLHTARTHVQRVLQKLGVRSRQAAAEFARRNRLVDAVADEVPEG